jgi:hypothetical protein
MIGLVAWLDVAEPRVDRAKSDFQVGERRDPCAAATAGVPFPTLRILSLVGRSGDGAFEQGWLFALS